MNHDYKDPMELLKARMNDYMSNFFIKYQHVPQDKLPEWKPEVISFKDMPFEEMTMEKEDEVGRYWLNKEVQAIDLQKAKLVILDPNDPGQVDENGNSFIDQPKWKWILHVQKTSAGKLVFPGLEYEAYIMSLPENERPQEFYDGKQYHIIGSVFRSADGEGNVTRVGLNKAQKFDRDSSDLAERKKVTEGMRILAFEA